MHQLTYKVFPKPQLLERRPSRPLGGRTLRALYLEVLEPRDEAPEISPRK
jgi:hypothetical protein